MPQVHGTDSSTGLPSTIKATAEALWLYIKSLIAGERQPDSTSGADHMCIAGEWKSATVTISGTGDYTVYAAPCVVRSVRVRKTTNAGVATTTLAGIVLVKDGTTVKEGSTAAAGTAGAVLYDCLDGAIFSTSLILNFASASDTNKIEVLYRPLAPNVTWQVL